MAELEAAARFQAPIGRGHDRAVDALLPFATALVQAREALAELGDYFLGEHHPYHPTCRKVDAALAAIAKLEE